MSALIARLFWLFPEPVHALIARRFGREVVRWSRANAPAGVVVSEYTWEKTDG